MPAPTLDDLKKQLNRSLTDTSDDGELTIHLAAAIEAVEGKVGPLTVREFTEQHRPAGRWIALDQRPVVSVTSVTASDGGQVQLEDDAVDAAAATVKLPIAGGGQPYTVVYQAGSATPLTSYVLAALIIGQHLWNAQHGGGGRVMPGDEPVMVPGIAFAIPMRAAELLSGDLLPGFA